MTSSHEVVITSSTNDNVVSAYMWDASNGTSLMTYRGDAAVTTTGLSLLAGQYVLAALQNKPFLRVWPVNSQQPLSGVRLVCAGRVTHAQASPDHCYIAVTTAEKVHLYQVGSGRLLNTGSRHFQPITVVRWSRDGTVLVCGGEDGLVTVWPLATLATPQSTPEPRLVLSDHSLPVSDLIITAGIRPRLVTVSADRTCKIYDLALGTLLVSVVFNNMLTAVTMSPLESEVYVGTDSGSVLQFSLLSPPRHLEYHLTAEKEESVPVFSGHSGPVSSLSMSQCGVLLLSGSTDSTVKIWHITSGQCLRTLQHKGAVTNAFFVSRPKQLFENELKPSVVISDFKSSVGVAEAADCVEVVTEQSLCLCDNTDDLLFPVVTDSSDAKVTSLQTEVELLRSINSSLYQFAVEKIIKDNSFPTKDTEKTDRQEQQKMQKQTKKEMRKLNKHIGVNKNTNSSKQGPVNGLAQIKKKKKKNKKKSTRIKIL